jgi:uncharacterized Zn-binding protein involved in type VI secretion
MKNALSFAVALGLVAGVVSVASAAELTINGDARWRGVYKQNTTDSTDHNDVTPGVANQGQDTTQKMDQRYRFNANVKINDDVTVNTRWVLRDGEFGNENGASDLVDRANMVIKTLGGTWTIGRQDVSWGNKFLAWGESADRIKAVYKSGDITFGGFLQKDRENNGSLTNTDLVNGDGDKDSWAGIFIAKFGDTTVGVLPVYSTEDSSAAKASGRDTGYLIDPYFTTKMGPATVMGEMVYKGGDLNENSDGDAVWGGFVAASVDLAPVTVKALFAYYDGNEGDAGGTRDCDNDFAPSVLIGTCNETAVIDFGGTTRVGNGTPTTAATVTADDFTYLVGAGVDFKASDKLTVGGLVGYLMATDKDGYSATGGEEAASLIEVDLTAKYALAQNANYTFSIGYGMPDQFSAQDDDWVVIGNRIEVAW